jgi:hypothetical protein
MTHAMTATILKFARRGFPTDFPKQQPKPRRKIRVVAMTTEAASKAWRIEERLRGCTKELDRLGSTMTANPELHGIAETIAAIIAFNRRVLYDDQAP